MREFKTKLGEDGRVVIPAGCRKALKLLPGAELVIFIDEDHLHLYTKKTALKAAQARVTAKTKQKSLVKALKEMRNKDASND